MDYKEVYKEYIKARDNLWKARDKLVKKEAYQEKIKQIVEGKQMNKKEKLVDKLIELANNLDEKNLHKQANKIDNLLYQIKKAQSTNYPIDLLQKALRAEYQQWDMYYSYKEELSGQAKDSIAEHFEEHGEDEQGHIKILQRYLVDAGVQPTKQRDPIPQIQGSVEKFIALQLKHELQAVDLYKEILSKLPENDPLRIDIENFLTKENEHAQDLQQLIENKAKG